MTRILLAEDEALVRELIIEDLNDAGFEVVAARDGEEALQILREDSNFDVLFTDIRMPGSVDGWQLAEHGRQLISGLRVIYSTGLGEADRAIGPTDRFLTKPYRLDALLKVLETG